MCSNSFHGDFNKEMSITKASYSIICPVCRSEKNKDNILHEKSKEITVLDSLNRSLMLRGNA